METDKAVSVQLPPELGNSSVLKGGHLGLRALVLDGRKGLAAMANTENTSFSTDTRATVCTLQTQPPPCFSGLSSPYSLLLVQSPHVFVCEKIQERNVANGLMNITHCNFFGNPVGRRRLVSNCQRLSQDVAHQLLRGL